MCFFAQGYYAKCGWAGSGMRDAAGKCKGQDKGLADREIDVPYELTYLDGEDR